MGARATLRVLVVAGARPNFMKVAPILRELGSRGHEGVLVHTGQHYDGEMSEAFFRDLELPDPDFHLGVGSASHAVQTARIMEAFEPVLGRVDPDWVVVVGDVNSTLGCALVAAKVRGKGAARIAHVEAGLRSGDRRMPEEVNRVLTDRISDLLLVPSRDAIPNLEREGIAAERVRFAGNVMIDTLLHQLPKARELGRPEALGLERGEYVVATLHRPSNVDEPGALRTALAALRAVGRDRALVIPLHPRTVERVERFGLDGELEGLLAIPPAGYREMVALLDGAALVLTDSGGIQEETTALGVPCVTLREQTERPITLVEGTNRMAPWPLGVEGVREAADEALARGRRDPGRGPEGWDGRAAERVVRELERAGGR